VKPEEFISKTYNSIFTKLDNKVQGININFPKGFPHNKKTMVPTDKNGNDYIFVGFINSMSVSFIEDDIYYYVSRDGRSLAMTIDHT
jgi:hypothetical protein